MACDRLRSKIHVTDEDTDHRGVVPWQSTRPNLHMVIGAYVVFYCWKAMYYSMRCEGVCTVGSLTIGFGKPMNVNHTISILDIQFLS